MTAFKPVGDKVLLKLGEAVEKSAGGLYLAGNAVKKNAVATVVAVGEGRETFQGTVPLRVKVGDEVMIVPGTGIEVDVSGEKFIVLREGEILGVTKSNERVLEPSKL